MQFVSSCGSNTPLHPCLVRSEGEAVPLEFPARGQGMAGGFRRGQRSECGSRDKCDQQCGKLPGTLSTSQHFCYLGKLGKTHFNFYFYCYFFWYVKNNVLF